MALLEGYTTRDIAIGLGFVVLLSVFLIVVYKVRNKELADNAKDEAVLRRKERLYGRKKSPEHFDETRKSVDDGFSRRIKGYYMGQSLSNQHQAKEDIHDIKDTLHDIDDKLGD